LVPLFSAIGISILLVLRRLRDSALSISGGGYSARKMTASAVDGEVANLAV
jgi:hypothetical protein